MIGNFVKRMVGSRNDRVLKSYQSTVNKINALEPKVSALSDEELQAKTEEFKLRISKGESLDKILPEAFAVVREASKRVLGMRHFDVQLIGGIALHSGKIAEMRTGEGKTLVGTLPAYLNALSGKGVYVVTVNDYLAARDADVVGKLHRWLGLTVGVILSEMPQAAKKEAYNCDITYGTNNEFGFDYLRDNMVFDLEEKVQRDLHYAIIDEVDSILIDEARTPLIISGLSDDRPELYVKINELVSFLDKGTEETDGVAATGDFWVDEKTEQVHLTEAGHEKVEKMFIEHNLMGENHTLYDASNIALLHHLMAALKAHFCFFKDQHYVVNDGEVKIVDEFTGRIMEGRRWSDGLHQAVEAKEAVEIQNENVTLASITYQNYFRLFSKLAGMTGTADTEAFEFNDIYKLETIVIPTHRKIQRHDFNDQIFRSSAEKYSAIIDEIKLMHSQGRPVLVGTTSIENSELLSELLAKQNLFHQVLNAKHHAREAEIIAQAGRPGMITIATNMAGRGTDIVLGGNIEKVIHAVENDEELSFEERVHRVQKLKDEWVELNRAVVDAGGLHIIGSERHESRRIDNQLRGRAGRQGDPGSSRFFLSLDDHLLRVFAGERLRGFMDKLNLPEGMPIEHPLLTKAIASAQKKVEGQNYDIRKNVLKYDNVSNDQRKAIYSSRAEILAASDVSEFINNMRYEYIEYFCRFYIPKNSVEDMWDIKGLELALNAEFHLTVPVQQMYDNQQTENEIMDNIHKAADDAYVMKTQSLGDSFKAFEKTTVLDVLDYYWREHLTALDQIRKGIGLRAYAQKNPEREYQMESLTLFENLLASIRNEVTRRLMTLEIVQPSQIITESIDLEENKHFNSLLGVMDEVGEVKESAMHAFADPIVDETNK